MYKFLENPPELQINKVLYSNKSMPVHVRLEQRIVWNLLKALEDKCFRPVAVDDSEEVTRVTSKVAAMELLFNLDDAYLILKHDTETDQKVWVRLVFGNGVDVISDFAATNQHGFENVMDKFDAEEYA